MAKWWEQRASSGNGKRRVAHPDHWSGLWLLTPGSQLLGEQVHLALLIGEQ